MSAPSNFVYTSKLQGSRVLIIGGTSGIGFGVARACLENGADLVLSSSNPSKIESKIQSLRDTYPSLTKQTIISHACDLSDPQTLESNIVTLLSSATNNGENKLNHIVSTAGNSLKFLPISDATVQDILAAGTVRVIASMMLAKHAPKHMVPGSESSMTFTGGMSAQRPRPNWSIMATWGSSLEGLVRGLAVDLKPMRVNLVNPGAIKTELFAGMNDEVMEGFAKGTLVGKLGRPEDIAEAYVYLLKDGFVTGTSIGSNGGALIA
jgi:NAD(P)-dependent dehydrogenase (short-subunit alcohol dehydrogenase family)